jgi:hypothetical protein
LGPKTPALHGKQRSGLDTAWAIWEENVELVPRVHDVTPKAYTTAGQVRELDYGSTCADHEGLSLRARTPPKPVSPS